MLHERCELKRPCWASRRPAAKTNKETPNKPPILNQIHHRNRPQIGLSEPNLRPKFHTGTPYTAGAAAQNVQLQPGSSPKNFSRVNQAPSPRTPEPVTWPTALPTKPYTRRALRPSPTKTKTLARHTAKTHPFYPPTSPPTSPPTGPEPPLQKQVL